MTKVTNKTKDDQMEKLLNSTENPILPKLGEIIDGEVIYVGRNEVLVDINGLLTGLIRGHEAFDESGEFNNLKVGDKIAATVIDTENEKGLMELSLRQAGHKKAWDKLSKIKQEGEIVEVVVLDANKGGLMIKLDNILGFLPVSQLSAENYPRVVGGNRNKILEKLKNLINKKLKVKILDINDEEGTLIVSEKETASDKRKENLAKYKKGDVVEGTITGVVDFGAFMSFGSGLEGLIHISELGWQRIDDPKNLLKEGQKVKAQIIEISTNKVSLSLKRLTKDPWKLVENKYKVGDKVTGKVVKEHKFGAFVEIETDIQGLARAESEADKAKMQLDAELDFVITNFSPVAHKLGLVLAGGKGSKTSKLSKSSESSETGKTSKTSKASEEKESKKVLKQDNKEVKKEASEEKKEPLKESKKDKKESK